MNPILLLVVAYVVLIFIDISVVLVLHNKYGYVHYFKNSITRQLMYLVLLSILMNVVAHEEYLNGFSNLTLYIAIVQLVYYFYNLFPETKQTKTQTVAIVLAMITMVGVNIPALTFMQTLLISVISGASFMRYLRYYDKVDIRTRVIFVLAWTAMGANHLIIRYSSKDLFLYWLAIAFVIWISQSFLTSLIYRSTVRLFDKAPSAIQMNVSELKDKILEFAPVSLILTDHTSRILYVNKSVEKMTGYSVEELIGKKTRIFQSGDTPVRAYQEMWQTIKRGKEWHGTLKNKRKDGVLYWEDITIIPIVSARNIVTNYLGVKFDSSKAIVERSILENNAYFDDLTGTLRRRRFYELMNETMQFRANSPFFVIMIDVDKFKVVNDSLGHAVGDHLLAKISELISNVYSSKNSFLSRVGGDEFVIFTYGIQSEEVYAGVEHIKALVANINQSEEFKDINVSVSIGVSKVVHDLDSALKKADVMMYSDKHKQH